MTSHTARPFDADGVLGLFEELSVTLEARGVAAQLFVLGGAAMALAYDRGRVTRDVDALFTPAPQVRQAAEEVATRRGLEPDWLNDAAKGFLPGMDTQPLTVFESDWLIVQVPSPEYLLAMKLFASREERDLADAAVLFAQAGYTTIQDGIDLLVRSYPERLLLPRHRFILQDVIQRATQHRQPPGGGETDPDGD
ncbi:MAG: hypothetical protein LBG60_10225 [Bifidobacteriaceae bacterium]|jgi:hypothetical protein|nr:hypothetical protein [Bifidobacteriaceae bacterium]